MIIRFFRSSFAAQYVLVVLLAVVLWLPAFLKLPAAVEFNIDRQPLFGFTLDALAGFPLLQLVLALLLLLFQAFFFNAFLATHQLIRRIGSTGAFVYVLLFSSSPELTRLYPFLIAAVFILAALHTLFLIYEAERPYYYVFNAGFFVAMAALFYTPTAILFFWVIISLVIALHAKVRNFLIAFVGFLTPVYLLMSWFFLTDQLAGRLAGYGGQWINLLADFSQVPVLQYVIGLMLLLLLIYALGPVLGNETEKNLGLRKKINITHALLFFSVLMLFFQRDSLIFNSVLLLPLAVYISFDFAYAHKLRWRNSLLFVLLLLIVVNQYYSLLF
ncbi:MAG: hypothetical protein K8F24_03780 [Bacteroidales bacterium]|nr:hypothetical protein [Bacteroidales bacterium]